MKNKVDLYFIALHVGLVALCAVVVLLTLENRRMRELLAPQPGGPVAGQNVDAFLWQSLEGEESTLEFASAEQESLLLVFTTDCPACQKNQDAWRELHQAVGQDVNVVGISLSDLDATRNYSQAHGLTFPVGVPAEPQDFIQKLAISGVPTTIRVGADGRVVESWSGALSERLLSELSKSSSS